MTEMRNRRRRLGPLWKSPDFMRFWTGQAVSQLGSQITELALPLTAIVVLRASPTQMGLVAAVGQAPYFLLSLIAGVWVDRFDRRRLLILADIGRAVCLAVVPAAYVVDRLSLPLLATIAFLFGSLTVLFLIAYQSYLPDLVERQHLMEGNGKLELSRSSAQISGPPLAGWLIQSLKAPVAITIDAVSFLVSAMFLQRIRRRPEPRPPAMEKPKVLPQVMEGVRFVFKDRSLRAMAIAAGIFNFSFTGCTILMLLFLRGALGFEPAMIGLALSAFGPGLLLGALVAPKAGARLGIGRTLVLAAIAGDAAFLLVPLAPGSRGPAVAFVLAGNFLFALGMQLYNITLLTARQALVPMSMQGRMHSTIRLIAQGLAPLGAVVAGIAGDKLGLRVALIGGTFGMILAGLVVAASPLSRLRSIEDAQTSSEASSPPAGSPPAPEAETENDIAETERIEEPLQERVVVIAEPEGVGDLPDADTGHGYLVEPPVVGAARASTQTAAAPAVVAVESASASGQESPKDTKVSSSAGDGAMYTTDVVRVVVNVHGAYSVWPMGESLPNGWSDTGVSGSLEDCLDEISKRWTLKPRSLQMAGQDSPIA